VCRLAPGLGPLPVQALQLLQRGFQFPHAPGSLGALQAFIAGGAFSHALATQAYQRTARHRHDSCLQLRVCAAVILQLVQQRVMQVAPFTNGLALVVTLLPAMQAMLGGVVLLIAVRLRLIRVVFDPQAVFECVQHLRNMVVELCA
jgi:hypothetical protein